MESQKGRQIHGLSEKARESGEFIEALKLIEEALANYIQDGDLLGAAEALASKVLILRQLYNKTGKNEFLDLAQIAAEKSVKMAEKSGHPEALALPLHTLGKVCEDMEKWAEAADAQEKALEVMKKTPPERHNRPAFLAEIRVHLFTDKYMAGDKNALVGLDEATVELEKDANELKYNRDTWLSGAFMSKAKILKDDNPAAASEALAKAKKVIEANPELKLRAEQWQKLAAEFKV